MARDFPCDPLDLEIPLGTTWEETWELQDDTGAPLDLTGYVFRMMLRSRDGKDTELLEISSIPGGDGRATVDALTGTVSISVTAADVSALSPSNTKLRTLWDAELYVPGDAPGDSPFVIPVMNGSAVFTPRKTRPVVMP